MVALLPQRPLLVLLFFFAAGLSLFLAENNNEPIGKIGFFVGATPLAAGDEGVAAVQLIDDLSEVDEEEVVEEEKGAASISVVNTSSEGDDDGWDPLPEENETVEGDVEKPGPDVIPVPIFDDETCEGVEQCPATPPEGAAKGKNDSFRSFDLRGAVYKNVGLSYFGEACPRALIEASNAPLPYNYNDRITIRCTGIVSQPGCKIPLDWYGRPDTQSYRCFYTKVTLDGPDARSLEEVIRESVRDQRFRRVLTNEKEYPPNNSPYTQPPYIESRNWQTRSNSNPTPRPPTRPPVRPPTRPPYRPPTSPPLTRPPQRKPTRRPGPLGPKKRQKMKNCSGRPKKNCKRNRRCKWNGRTGCSLK